MHGRGNRIERSGDSGSERADIWFEAVGPTRLECRGHVWSRETLDERLDQEFGANGFYGHRPTVAAPLTIC